MYTTDMNWWMLKRRLHISWLIATAALGVLIGVVAAQYETQSFFGSFIWVVVGSAACLVAFWKKQLYLIPLVLIGGTVIGLWRGSLDQRALAPYESLIGHTVVINGHTTEEGEIGKKGEITLRITDLSINGHPMAGTLWVSAGAKGDIKRSDQVTVTGTVQEGFGRFSAAMYRAQIVKVERPVPGDMAARVREWFATAVRDGIQEPQASLGIGYVTGQRSALPSDLEEALRIAGLTHIVVASGYNLTILVRVARRLFSRVSKYLSALTAGSMIASFIAITGASPSMSRAGVVAGLALLAWYYGRAFHPLVLLLFVAAVTVLVHPSYAWGDLGWQLSFAAFAGVMILAPLMQRYFFGPRKPSFVRQLLGETIAAQIATMPILLFSFGQMSNVAIVANLLILPFVPLAMLLTFIAGVGGALLPAADIIAQPAYLVLHYMTTVIHYVAQLPGAMAELTIGIREVAIGYIAIIIGCWYMWHTTKFNLREANIVE